MNPWDIAIIVIVCVAFAGVCGWLLYRKIKHKGGCCGCDCGSCCGCGAHGEGGGNETSCPHCKGENKK